MRLQDIIDEIFEETTNEDLRNWFKSKWVNIGKKDKSGKHPPCGTSGKKKGYAKCVPASKAKSMSKKEKEYADLGFEELIEDYGYAEVGSDFSSVREHIRDEYRDNPAHRDSMDALLIHQYIQAGKRAKRSGKVISEAK